MISFDYSRPDIKRKKEREGHRKEGEREKREERFW